MTVPRHTRLWQRLVRVGGAYLARRSAGGLLAAVLLAVWTFIPCAWSQQQQQGLCARVKIVILQELALERVGFEATLEITNNDGEDPITDFFASLTFENPQVTTNGVNDASSLFFVRAPTFESLNGVNGDGVIAPSTKSVIRWFIIPKLTAGGTTPDGIRYSVGCQLAGKIRGVEIPPAVLSAFPATIFVKPDPQLEITYFQPRDVQGDDPFTPQVESPIPFTVGVLVKNSGYGIARKLKIDSQQPKIVENKQNLLLIAQLLGSRVHDQFITPPTLTVNLGDIPPGQTRKGAWDMITSLSGEFVEFKASYTHASELGGLDTSVIKAINAYFIAHEVFNDQAGRDPLKDFLADTDRDENMLPDALYESEGNVLPVNTLTNATVIGGAGPGGSFSVNLAADRTGWGYVRLNDPGQALLPIASVVRSDGKILNPNNYWTNIRYEKITNNKRTFLNLFDLVDLANYTYTVTYAVTVADVTSPVTTMRFAGSVNLSGGKYYITPDTQMYFTSEDVSPVSIVYSVTNGPFLPALPFFLTAPGEYPVVFRATDAYNNIEANHTNVVVVSDSSALDFASVGNPGGPIYVPGDALSVRAFNAPLPFQASFDPSPVDAQAEVFQGVVGWATVSGVPSSPTTANTASLTIGGENVDYYRYRLNGGAWSAEQPIVTPLNLASLGTGAQTVSVLGRSRYGSYLDASNAVSVAWAVEPNAPAARITGTPATPSRLRSAALHIAGNGVTAFRWTLNNGYYRPETNAPGEVTIPITSSTTQALVFAVLGKTNGVFQPTNSPTTVAWLYDPMFGYPQPALPRVRSVTFTNIGTNPQVFAWDGRNDSGVPLSPGWYTERLTLRDQLGRTNFITRLVQIGDVAGTSSVLADSSRGPKNPHARGRRAVWQDQSDGNFQIYAQDLTGSNAILKITNTGLGQENPRTDGRYLVWQGRQVNGNWDLYLKDLSGTNAPTWITSTSGSDEINPAIDWPWVVYQTRALNTPSAPWRLRALNLVTAQSFLVSASTQDQLDPEVQAGRVVWQDWRDVGPGEIYFHDLETGEERRVTTNSFGQYHPVLHGNFIAWQDNRNGEVDLYGYDLLRQAEVRLTSTAENETRPFLDGPWLVCQEDSLGPLTANIRLIHLPSLGAVPITRSLTLKDRPALAGGRALWLDTQNNLSSLLMADLPALQGVFQNQNAVVVTDAMAASQQNAHTLLTLWQAQAGVIEITRYASLVPSVVSERAYWTNGAPAGPNFTLGAGSFLWVKFGKARVLDLGVNVTGPISLPAGASVLSYARFPGGYTAYRLLNQLGSGTARGVRMLDSESGRWVAAEVQGGRPVGTDFTIPNVAVLLLDLTGPVNNFTPLSP
jgi:beta propeller repeat protein